MQTKNKREYYQLSLRKTKQSEIIGQKRQLMSKVFENEDSRHIRSMIKSKNIENVQKICTKLIQQLLDLEITYKLTENQILTLLVDVSANYNCNNVFLHISDNESLMFFKKLLENIYKRTNVEPSYFLVTNILFDDNDEQILKYIIEKCNFINIMLSHIDENLDLVLIENNLKLICMIAHKSVIYNNEDFVILLVKKINEILDKEGIGDAVIKNSIVLSGYYIAEFPELFDFNELKLIKTTTISLYYNIMIEKSKEINPIIGILKIFSTIVNSSETPRQTIEFVIKTVKIHNIIELLKIPNSTVTKYTLWMLTNILVDFKDEEERKLWEPEYDELSDLISEVALREYEGLAKNAILSLTYLFAVLDENFLVNYYEKNIQILIEYFKQAFSVMNAKILDMQLNLFELVIEKIPSFVCEVKNDELVIKAIEKLQKNENEEIIVKTALLINKLC